MKATDLFFKVWLFVKYKVDIKFGEFNAYQHTVSDHYGPIDTLGWSVNEGRLTYHYSCEMFSQWEFKFPFGFRFCYYNGCEKCLFWRRAQSDREIRIRRRIEYRIRHICTRLTDRHPKMPMWLWSILIRRSY